MYELAADETTRPADSSAMNLTCSWMRHVMVPSYVLSACVDVSPMPRSTEVMAVPGSVGIAAFRVRIAPASDAVSANAMRRRCSAVSRPGSPPPAVATNAATTSTFDVDHARCEATAPSTVTLDGLDSGAKAQAFRVSPARLGRGALAEADGVRSGAGAEGATGEAEGVAEEAGLTAGEVAWPRLGEADGVSRLEFAAQAPAVPTRPASPLISSARRLEPDLASSAHTWIRSSLTTRKIV